MRCEEFFTLCSRIYSSVSSFSSWAFPSSPRGDNDAPGTKLMSCLPSAIAIFILTLTLVSDSRSSGAQGYRHLGRGTLWPHHNAHYPSGACCLRYASIYHIREIISI